MRHFVLPDNSVWTSYHDSVMREYMNDRGIVGEPIILNDDCVNVIYTENWISSEDNRNYRIARLNGRTYFDIRDKIEMIVKIEPQMVRKTIIQILFWRS